MVLAVDIGLGDHKDVVEEELAKVLEVVALPVVDARLEGLDGLLVLRAPLRLVDLVRDALRRFGPPLELVVVRVRRRRTRFDKRLETNKAREQDSNPSISTCQFFLLHRNKTETYIKEKGIFADALDRLDKQTGQLALDVDQVVQRLLTVVWSALGQFPMRWMASCQGDGALGQLV